MIFRFAAVLTLLSLNALSYAEAPLYREGVVVIKFRPEAETFLNAPTISRTIFSAAITDIGIENIVPMFRAHNVYFNTSHPLRSVPALANVHHEALSHMYLVHFPAELNVLKVARALQADPLVEYAEPRGIQHISSYNPNDPSIAQQGHLVPIKIFEAWDVTKGDSTVIIGIDDSGTQWDHPDLIANIYQNPGETGTDSNGNDKRSNGIDDDNNGYIDDWHGWDFSGADKKTPDNNPINGQHGTHVAGLAGARTDNGVGVAGTGFRCKIMPLKTAMDFKEGDGIFFGYEAMVYAADNGASVINCSWGGGGALRADQEIINYVTSRGSLVVAAYGNNGQEGFFYPGAYDHVLGVTSTTNSDKPSGFSNYGIRADVASPGDNDYSTYPTNTYRFLAGTSMASPVAAGVCALVKSRFPQFGPDQIAERVRVTADANDQNYTGQNAVRKKLMGYGRINALRAVSDGEVKSIRIDSVLVDNLSHPGGAINPGDTAVISIRFKNYLDPTRTASTTLVNYKTSSAFTILDGSSTLDPMATLATKVGNAPYKIVVNENSPVNSTLKFRIDINDNTYSDYDYFEFLVRPTFKVFDQNDITATVTSNGSIGFNDLAVSQGLGFLYKNSDNLLFEGSFMVGTDATHVVDVARGANAQSGTKDADFTERTLLDVLTPGENGTAQSGRCSFTDSLAPSANKIGIAVSTYAYEQKTPGIENTLFVEQTITNTTSLPLTSLYAGYFFDWDISVNGGNDITEFHDGCNFASVRVNADNPMVGVTIVPRSGALPLNFWAFDNATVNDGFTKAEKWQALSSGTLTSPKKGPLDVSHVIASGPFTLAPNESITIPYAIFAGTSLEQLRQTANTLRGETCAPLGVEQSNQEPLGFALEQNYPNPFSSQTTIHFSIAQPEEHVSLVVRDALGRIVRDLFNGEPFERGSYNVKFQTGGLAAGIYEYTLSTVHSSITRRLVVAQ